METTPTCEQCGATAIIRYKNGRARCWRHIVSHAELETFETPPSPETTVRE